MYTVYEKHNYMNPDFPIFFHLDRIDKTHKGVHVHWHEHVELLYIMKGSCTVQGNGIEVYAQTGDIIMITPNCIHDIYIDRDICEYYCITADKGFCDSFNVPVCAGQFAMVIKEEQAKKCYDSIIEIMNSKPSYFQAEAKMLVLQLMIRCCRLAESRDIERENTNSYSKTVAHAVDYLRAHFSDPVTVDELCSYLGFSKFYLCRKFKAETGRTVIDYLNFLRCANARRLIASGQHNVSESAQLSGFNNMSYFTKTYKKQMGSAPSEQLHKV